MTARPIITLTTDFGLVDEYVASMKGVILSINPSVHIVDISHQVAQGDIQGASFLLGRAYSSFPDGTIHVVVVDPGVGSGRRILAIQAARQIFIGPDNGVLSAALTAPTTVEAVYSVQNQELFRTPVSSTFHGRDIMAPTAAHLSSGLNIEEIGEPVVATDCNSITPPECRIDKEGITGSVIHIDRFGNLCTNITGQMLQPFLNRGKCTVRIRRLSIRTLSSHYADNPSGELLAHLDSHNHLEIAVTNGSAAAFTDGSVGDDVIVELT